MGIEFRRLVRTAALAASASLISLALPAGPAAAQEYVPASSCFSTSPPGATVYSVVRPGFGVGLLCGDQTQGVLHIDQAHPIAEDGSDDETIPRCIFNIFTRSDRYEIPADPGKRAMQIRRPSGGTATAVYFESNGRIVTMFTSDGLGNNWAACAAYTER